MKREVVSADAKRCTIVITVHGRQRFLPRVTSYYADFGAEIVVADSSPQPAPAHYLCGRQLRYEHVPGENYYAKMLRVYRSINTPYVVECPDDDFVLKKSILEAISIFDSEPQTVCVAGSVINLSSRRMRLWEDQSWQLHARNMAFNRPELRTLRRLAATMRYFTALNHFVYRREVLLQAFDLVFANPHLWPVRFFDKILGYVTACAGRIRFLPRPMCVRDETRVMDTSQPYPAYFELGVPFSAITDRLRSADPLAPLLVKVVPGAEATLAKRLNQNLFSRTFGRYRHPAPGWLTSRYGTASSPVYGSELDEVTRCVRGHRSFSDSVQGAYLNMRGTLGSWRRRAKTFANPA